MSFLSSLGFGSSAPKPPAQSPQGDSNNNNMNFGSAPNGASAVPANPASMPGAPNNGGSNNQNSGQPAEPAHPMDKFKGMFDNKANTETAPAFSLDGKILRDAANGQDFMKGINPEMVQRATSGDTAALMSLMNEVGRNAYAASLEHGGRLTESFVSAREGFGEKSFGKKVRGELTVNALTGTPNFKNPVVREQLTRIANDFQKQHPDAAPGEIADMAKDYITELSKAIGPQNTEQQNSKQQGPTDFGEWFSDPAH